MLVLILSIKTTLSQTVEVCASVWVDFVKNTQTLYSLKIDGHPLRQIITFKRSLCITMLFPSKTYIEEWRGVLLNPDFDRWFPFSTWNTDVVTYRFVFKHCLVFNLTFFLSHMLQKMVRIQNILLSCIRCLIALGLQFKHKLAVGVCDSLAGKGKHWEE